MSTIQLCDECGATIGNDDGPRDGWQLEDGRTVCHACCVADTRDLSMAVIEQRLIENLAAGAREDYERESEWRKKDH